MLHELNEIFNPTLVERVDKSVVGKLINVKVYLDWMLLKSQKNHKFTDELAENSINQSLENFKEGESI